ncbi:MAG: L-serine ammonia-lyase, iron-sulfur-dependent subunit beta [Clostridia bacterium]|nr:L-serine ammonia-lyase, iron-sulfur-dependent subunit beta [Clostridia bacterium]
MFDILGPVTVGPSSSHTAGAVRIGLVCRTLLGGEVRRALITFYGSFADTYKGHGTDKAVVGGLLGFDTDNEKIKESLRIAEFRGMVYGIRTAEDIRYHPNTVVIEAAAGDRKVKVKGESTGGGSIRIAGINDFQVDAVCLLDTMVIMHRDTPGILAEMTRVFASNGYNIGNLRLSRAKRDGNAVTVVETDVPVDADTGAQIREIKGVSDVVSIPRF